MEIGDTSEEAVNINETTTESVEETEPAENAENTEKFGNTIMFLILLISIWLLRICSLVVISATAKTLLKRGLARHIWMKQYPSKDFRH